VPLLLILLLVTWIYTQRREHFRDNIVAVNQEINDSNEGPDPWNHHQVESSIPINLDVKYQKAYYYEFDNATYENALRATFQYSCPKGAEYLQAVDWYDLEPQQTPTQVAVAYDAFIEYLAKTLNASKALELPYDNPDKRPEIQVVHDRLIGSKMHVTIPFKYVLKMEAVLYREGKYHGKHILATVLAEYNETQKVWSFSILEMSLQGIVYEDSIGMFPVTAKPYLSYTEMPYDSDWSTVLADDEAVRQVVAKQNDLQRKNAEANLVLMKN
jgi:hypothetical protein